MKYHKLENSYKISTEDSAHRRRGVVAFTGKVWKVSESYEIICKQINKVNVCRFTSDIDNYFKDKLDFVEIRDESYPTPKYWVSGPKFEISETKKLGWKGFLLKPIKYLLGTDISETSRDDLEGYALVCFVFSQKFRLPYMVHPAPFWLKNDGGIGSYNYSGKRIKFGKPGVFCMNSLYYSKSSMRCQPISIYVYPQKGMDRREVPAYLAVKLYHQDSETKDFHHVVNKNGKEVELVIPLKLKKADLNTL